jgi:hypothetical protein
MRKARSGMDECAEKMYTEREAFHMASVKAMSWIRGRPLASRLR